MTSDFYSNVRRQADEYGWHPPRARRDMTAIRSRRGGYGRAAILSDEQIQRVRDFIRSNRATPEVDELKFLLSVRAGLRGGEIAAIEMESFLTADGSIGRTIEVQAHWAKNKQSRSIPMHPDIRTAIQNFRHRFPNATHVGVSFSKGRLQRQSASTLCHSLSRLYMAVGLKNCSSHSGRRTFITELSRRANKYHASLRDVQRLAGHARLDTTERYIEFSEDVAPLVQSLGKDRE